jgi:predicted RNA-binding Zn-ribbon protein involved in translation (DUF1610 family)
MREGKVMQILDPQTGEYLWHCPECGETIRLSSPAAVRLAEQAGRCQGCRAKATFQQKPELIGLFLDFWVRADAWPQSDSWLDAVSGCGSSILDHGYAMLGVAPKSRDLAATRTV